jgi:hypothetical protein
MKGDIRIKVTDTLGNVSYLIRNAPKANFTYMSGSETPLSLSNLVGKDAAEFRFALRDVRAREEAFHVCRAFIHHTYTVELLK